MGGSGTTVQTSSATHSFGQLVGTNTPFWQRISILKLESKSLARGSILEVSVQVKVTDMPEGMMSVAVIVVVRWSGAAKAAREVPPLQSASARQQLVRSLWRLCFKAYFSCVIYFEKSFYRENK